MSEKQFSPRSKTCVNLEKVQVVSSSRKPDKQFRHARGHQRAGALTGSINIIQNTVITVYGVESQKTDNADFENVLIGFQKKSKRYPIITFGRARMENEKKIKIKVALKS